jgi:hypothetical protein
MTGLRKEGAKIGASYTRHEGKTRTRHTMDEPRDMGPRQTDANIVSRQSVGTRVKSVLQYTEQLTP